MILRILDLDHVAVEINGVQLAGMIGKPGGIKVGFDGADAEDEVGGLDGGADRVVRSVASVDANVVGEGLVDGGLAHGGNEGGEVSFRYKVVDFAEGLIGCAGQRCDMSAEPGLH